MRVRRVWSAAAGIGITFGLLAGPAWAHVEVDVQPAQPGAADALVTFNAESESTTSGITKLEIVADPAITADQVTLAEGPAGWKVGTGSQGGFVLEGPAVVAGEDAEVAVRVKQLPNAPQVTFKVLQSYANGEIDRWIDPAGGDGGEAEHPAPVVKLVAGAQSATSESGELEAHEAVGADEDHHLARTGASGTLILAGVGTLLIGCGLLLRGQRHVRSAEGV
ncbi:MAG: DUF1775 domain-containing protein [Acidimicrobiia bacterium]